LGQSQCCSAPVGSAAAAKLALNQLIASLTSAFALSLGFVERQGVEVEQFMQILRQSALYAPTFDKKLQQMRDRNYANPNFPTKHLLKDTNLFLTEAQSIGLNVSSLEGVRKVLETAQQLGLSEADYSSLFSAITPEEP
jgi:3-hydroxyisobutyrate dehydrogenase